MSRSHAPRLFLSLPEKRDSKAAKPHCRISVYEIIRSSSLRLLFLWCERRSGLTRRKRGPRERFAQQSFHGEKPEARRDAVFCGSAAKAKSKAGDGESPVSSTRAFLMAPSRRASFFVVRGMSRLDPEMSVSPGCHGSFTPDFAVFAPLLLTEALLFCKIKSNTKKVKI